MKKYTALIDAGQGGEKIIEAETAAAAIRDACAWAADGDWDQAQENAKETGRDISATIYVQAHDDESDTDETTIIVGRA